MFTHFLSQHRAGLLSGTALLIALLMAGCGLFTPRPVEPPLEQSVIDPLDFARILTGTAERFDRLLYESLFHPDFEYETQDGRVFQRFDALSRYQKMERIYNSITVQWERDTAKTESPVFDREQVIVLYRIYSVATVRSADSGLFQGAARIELQYFNEINTWTIIRFVDSDLNSIFSPSYND